MSVNAAIIVPVYVSNLGCPHRCIFCDQTQYSEPVPPERIREYASGFIGRCRMPGERRRLLAFYGGSFTGIEKNLFDSYLRAGKALVEEGLVHGLKASTRPDMVDEERLSRLTEAGFVELEIGAQSMDDAVLRASMRGHTAEDVSRAARLIKASNLMLGIQIMPGLPGEDKRSFAGTVEAVCNLKPETARIYPTVVVRGTRLERMYERGEFNPLSLDEAVREALFAYIRFRKTGADILRMGVPVEGLDVVAGPVHPSFGFLVKSLAFRLMIGKALEGFAERVPASKSLSVKANPKDIQELIGYKRDTVKEFGFTCDADGLLRRGQIIVSYAEESACLNFEDIINHII